MAPAGRRRPVFGAGGHSRHSYAGSACRHRQLCSHSCRRQVTALRGRACQAGGEAPQEAWPEHQAVAGRQEGGCPCVWDRCKRCRTAATGFLRQAGRLRVAPAVRKVAHSSLTSRPRIWNEGHVCLVFDLAVIFGRTAIIKLCWKDDDIRQRFSGVTGAARMSARCLFENITFHTSDLKFDSGAR